MSRLDELIKERCPEGVPYLQISDVTKYEQPSKYIVKSTKYDDSYSTPVLTAGQTFILGYTNEVDDIYEASKESPVIIFDDFTAALKWVDFPFKVKSSAMKIITTDEDQVSLRYLYYIMDNIGYSSSEHKRLWISTYSALKIPVPPLEIQNEIVQILDNFAELTAELTAELSNRKKQYEYYRDLLLNFDENEQRERVKWFTISDIVTTKNARVKIMKNNYLTIGVYPIIDQSQKYIAGYTNDGGAVLPNDKYVIFGDHTTCLKYFEGEFAQGADGIKILIAKDFVVPKYLYYVMGSYKNFSVSYARHWSKMASTKVPIPSLEEQERIVRVLDQFDKLANDIAEGLPAEIEAREKQYAYYRDKLLSFEGQKVEMVNA